MGSQQAKSQSPPTHTHNRSTYPKAKQYHAPHPKPIQSLKMSHASHSSHRPKAKREAPNPPPINSNADHQSTLIPTPANCTRHQCYQNTIRHTALIATCYISRRNRRRKPDLVNFRPVMKTVFLAILALQICLDRRGFSPNAMDGQAGPKTHAALAAYCAANGLPPPAAGEEEFAFGKYFPDEPDLFTTVEVTAADIASLTAIPDAPAEKAKLGKMGYESVKEMFAERGHVTQNTLARLNPHIVWDRVAPGTKISIPETSPVAVGDKAAFVKISLSRFSVTPFDINGRPIAYFPCSIAKNRSKRPPLGEIKIITQIPDPNYTYTPDYTPKGKRAERHIFPPGPNNPVGVAWLGLSIPGYGIHGTPLPERIGRAESHGCFRLANWNVEKLYELVRAGTRVVIKP